MRLLMKVQSKVGASIALSAKIKKKRKMIVKEIECAANGNLLENIRTCS